MVLLANLPTFTYTYTTTSRRAQRRSRCSSHTPQSAEATYAHRNRVLPVRHTLRNTLSPHKWRHIAAPSYWPRSMNWPHDISKALLFKFATERRKGQPHVHSPTPRVLAELAYCHGVGCAAPKMRRLDDEALCTCSVAPWDVRNTYAWARLNISLEYASVNVGIRVVALQRFAAGTVLAEYLGELVPSSGPEVVGGNTAYVFDVGVGNGLPVCVDARRVGNWTRFINHSCRSNTVFVVQRVGSAARICVKVERDIEAGEEVTVDYESEYWEIRGKDGMFCECGEEKCRYKKRSRKGRK